MLEPVLIEGIQPGGQLTITTDVENFPGYPEGVLGPKMMDDLRNQAARFGTEMVLGQVNEVDFSKRPFTLKTDFDELRAEAVIICTGASARLLGLPNESKLMGHGVSACATCDGAFFPDKDVLVIGGGDSAMEEANFLTRFARKVTIVHRREVFRASKIMLERAQRNKKIDWLVNRRVLDMLANEKGKLRAVKLENTETGQIDDVVCHGAFVAIGHTPNSSIFEGQIEMDPEGYVLVHDGTHTSVEGVFAAGDISDRTYRQAITAAGMGCMAAMDAERWLEETHAREADAVAS
jgi:thioredoxin reductase (NADPH)